MKLNSSTGFDCNVFKRNLTLSELNNVNSSFAIFVVLLAIAPHCSHLTSVAAVGPLLSAAAPRFVRRLPLPLLVQAGEVLVASDGP